MIHKTAGLLVLFIILSVLPIADAQLNARDKATDLIQKLKSKHSRVRAEAAKELGKLKASGAVVPLINTLKDTDSYVRGNAAKALGEIKDASAVNPLIDLLKKDDSLYVRQESAKALGLIKDARGVDSLINALNDEYGEVREESTMALIEIGAPAIEPLERAVKENNVKKVADAYYFFICKGEPGTETVLINALNTYGTQRMAADFINCGNSRLKEAAHEWTESHGVKIGRKKDSGKGPVWKRCAK